MDQKNGSRPKQIKHTLRDLLRWLVPGLGVKRWFLLVIMGTVMIGVGLAVIVLEIYRTAPETWWLPALSAASLRFLSRPLRAIIFGGLGISLIMWGLIEMNRSLIRPFLRPGSAVVDTLRSHRQRGRGHTYCGSWRRSRSGDYAARAETHHHKSDSHCHRCG